MPTTPPMSDARLNEIRHTLRSLPDGAGLAGIGKLMQDRADLLAEVDRLRAELVAAWSRRIIDVPSSR